MKRVLVIDTLMINLTALHRGMNRKPWLIVTSTDPVDAAGFDAVITSWVGVGPEMVRRCRAAGVPFVIYTGAIINDIPEDVGGPVVFKPCPIDELLDVVRFAMGEMVAVDLVEGAAS